MTIGQSERATQNRIIALFRDQLDYKYLGNWIDRPNNRNIDDGLLTANLAARGYKPAHISRAIDLFRRDANNPNRSLYDNNKEAYSLLRYGVPVQVSVSENTETVKLIDWDNPLANDFAIAEEVTVFGVREKRPDLVLYVNGIAIGIIELKNSRVSIGDAIRQSLTNQTEGFISAFFSTVQFVFAGNDSEGVRYGTILTPEKMFLS